MTIKEAVEYHTKIKNKIKDVNYFVNQLKKSLCYRATYSHTNMCELDPKTIECVILILQDYINLIEDKLNQEFKE